MKIRLATRASRLALWQTEHVAYLLQKAGFDTEIVPMQTTGDAVQDRSLAKIGAKGVFTQELEDQPAARRDAPGRALGQGRAKQHSAMSWSCWLFWSARR